MAQTTMCDKIQTIGTNLQNNLNARGVTCTFGNTNGHTIYDLAQLINERNLKGIGDTNLKIMASNPYCVSGDTTDIIILLRNGVGTPITNQEVTISDGTNEHTLTTDANGKATLYNQGITQDKTYTATYNTFSDSCIVKYCTFVDYAVTNNHNDNWNGLQYMTRATDGTTISNTSGSTLFDAVYLNNTAIPFENKSMVVEFEIVENPVTSNKFRFDGQNLCDGESFRQWDYQFTNYETGRFKFIYDKANNTITRYKNGEYVNTITHHFCGKMGFLFRLENNASIKYKNFVIY